MDRPHDALTAQLLQWIDEGRHSYADALDTWKSSCPRLTIWEDACADGLLDAAPGRSGVVSLTAKGKAFLARHRPASAIHARARQATREQP